MVLLSPPPLSQPLHLHLPISLIYARKLDAATSAAGATAVDRFHAPRWLQRLSGAALSQCNNATMRRASTRCCAATRSASMRLRSAASTHLAHPFGANCIRRQPYMVVRRFCVASRVCDFWCRLVLGVSWVARRPARLRHWHSSFVRRRARRCRRRGRLSVCHDASRVCDFSYRLGFSWVARRPPAGAAVTPQSPVAALAGAAGAVASLSVVMPRASAFGEVGSAPATAKSSVSGASTPLRNFQFFSIFVVTFFVSGFGITCLDPLGEKCMQEAKRAIGHTLQWFLKCERTRAVSIAADAAAAGAVLDYGGLSIDLIPHLGGGQLLALQNDGVMRCILTAVRDFPHPPRPRAADDRL